jgi:hypothetical protein
LVYTTWKNVKFDGRLVLLAQLLYFSRQIVHFWGY